MDKTLTLKVKLSTDASELIALQKQLASGLVPKIDQSQLHDLNKTFDQKIKHHQQVQSAFDRNPLTPKIDTSQLERAIAKTEQLQSRLANLSSQVNASIDFSIQHSIDTSNLNTVFRNAADQFRQVGEDIAETIKEKIEKVRVKVDRGGLGGGGFLGGFFDELSRSSARDFYKGLDVSKQTKDLGTATKSAVGGIADIYAKEFFLIEDGIGGMVKRTTQKIHNLPKSFFAAVDNIETRFAKYFQKAHYEQDPEGGLEAGFGDIRLPYQEVGKRINTVLGLLDNEVNTQLTNLRKGKISPNELTGAAKDVFKEMKRLAIAQLQSEGFQGDKKAFAKEIETRLKKQGNQYFQQYLEGVLKTNNWEEIRQPMDVLMNIFRKTTGTIRKMNALQLDKEAEALKNEYAELIPKVTEARKNLTIFVSPASDQGRAGQEFGTAIAATLPGSNVVAPTLPAYSFTGHQPNPNVFEQAGQQISRGVGSQIVAGDKAKAAGGGQAISDPITGMLFGYSNSVKELLAVYKAALEAGYSPEQIQVLGHSLGTFIAREFADVTNTLQDVTEGYTQGVKTIGLAIADYFPRLLPESPNYRSVYQESDPLNMPVVAGILSESKTGRRATELPQGLLDPHMFGQSLATPEFQSAVEDLGFAGTTPIQPNAVGLLAQLSQRRDLAYRSVGVTKNITGGQAPEQGIPGVPVNVKGEIYQDVKDLEGLIDSFKTLQDLYKKFQPGQLEQTRKKYGGAVDTQSFAGAMQAEYAEVAKVTKDLVNFLGGKGKATLEDNIKLLETLLKKGGQAVESIQIDPSKFVNDPKIPNYIAPAGPVTYPKATLLQQTAENVPGGLDVVETKLQTLNTALVFFGGQYKQYLGVLTSETLRLGGMFVKSQAQRGIRGLYGAENLLMENVPMLRPAKAVGQAALPFVVGAGMAGMLPGAGEVAGLLGPAVTHLAGAGGDLAVGGAGALIGPHVPQVVVDGAETVGAFGSAVGDFAAAVGGVVSKIPGVTHAVGQLQGALGATSAALGQTTTELIGQTTMGALAIKGTKDVATKMLPADVRQTLQLAQARVPEPVINRMIEEKIAKALSAAPPKALPPTPEPKKSPKSSPVQPPQQAKVTSSSSGQLRRAEPELYTPSEAVKKAQKIEQQFTQTRQTAQSLFKDFGKNIDFDSLQKAAIYTQEIFDNANRAKKEIKALYDQIRASGEATQKQLDTLAGILGRLSQREKDAANLFGKIGDAAHKGITEGLEQIDTQALMSLMKRVAAAMQKGFNDKMDIHSPSGWAIAACGEVTAGFEIGGKAAIEKAANMGNLIAQNMQWVDQVPSEIRPDPSGLQELGKGAQATVYGNDQYAYRLNRIARGSSDLPGALSMTDKNATEALKVLDGEVAPKLVAMGNGFMVMERVLGETAAKAIRSAQSVEQIYEIFQKMGQTLALIHQSGIVHRDYQSGNVMVRPDGGVRAVDFANSERVGDNPAKKQQDLDDALRLNRSYLDTVNQSRQRLRRPQIDVDAAMGQFQQGYADVENTGQKIRQDLTAGISGLPIDLGEVGQESGLALLRGIKKALKIASPSDEMKDVGDDSRQGYLLGAEPFGFEEIGQQMGQSVSDGVKAKAEELITNGKEATKNLILGLDPDKLEGVGKNMGFVLSSSIKTGVEEVKRAGAEVNQFFNSEPVQAWGNRAKTEIKEFGQEISNQFPILGRAKNFLQDLATNVIQLFGAYTISDALVNAGRAGFQAALDFERMETSLDAVSNGQGAATMERLKQQANELSLGVKETVEGYKTLAAATRGTALEGEGATKIYTGFAEAMSAQALPAEQQARVFTQLGQSVGKGKIQMEELLTISENMPGTMQALQRALGMTSQEMFAQSQAGNLLAEDVYPKLAAQLSLENSGGVAAAAGTAQAMLTRMNNALLESQVVIGTQFAESAKPAIAAVTEALQFFSKNAELATAFVQTLALTAITGLISNTVALSSKLGITALMFKLAGWSAAEYSAQVATVGRANAIAELSFRALGPAAKFALNSIIIPAAIAGGIVATYQLINATMNAGVEKTKRSTDALRASTEFVAKAYGKAADEATRLANVKQPQSDNWFAQQADDFIINPLNKLQKSSDDFFSKFVPGFKRTEPIRTFGQNDRDAAIERTNKTLEQDSKNLAEVFKNRLSDKTLAQLQKQSELRDIEISQLKAQRDLLKSQGMETSAIEKKIKDIQGQRSKELEKLDLQKIALTKSQAVYQAIRTEALDAAGLTAEEQKKYIEGNDVIKNALIKNATLTDAQKNNLKSANFELKRINDEMYRLNKSTEAAAKAAAKFQNSLRDIDKTKINTEFLSEQKQTGDRLRVLQGQAAGGSEEVAGKQLSRLEVASYRERLDNLNKFAKSYQGALKSLSAASRKSLELFLGTKLEKALPGDIAKVRELAQAQKIVLTGDQEAALAAREKIIEIEKQGMDARIAIAEKLAERRKEIAQKEVDAIERQQRRLETRGAVEGAAIDLVTGRSTRQLDKLKEVESIVQRLEDKKEAAKLATMTPEEQEAYKKRKAELEDQREQLALKKQLASIVGEDRANQLLAGDPNAKETVLQQLLLRRQGIEDKIAELKRIASENELRLERLKLELDIKREQIAIRRAAMEAKTSQGQAKKDLATAEDELKSAMAGGDKQQIAEAKAKRDTAVGLLEDANVQVAETGQIQKDLEAIFADLRQAQDLKATNLLEQNKAEDEARNRVQQSERYQAGLREDQEIAWVRGDQVMNSESFKQRFGSPDRRQQINVAEKSAAEMLGATQNAQGLSIQGKSAAEVLGIDVIRTPQGTSFIQRKKVDEKGPVLTQAQKEIAGLLGGTFTPPSAGSPWQPYQGVRQQPVQSTAIARQNAAAMVGGQIASPPQMQMPTYQPPQAPSTDKLTGLANSQLFALQQISSKPAWGQLGQMLSAIQSLSGQILGLANRPQVNQTNNYNEGKQKNSAATKLRAGGR